MKIKMGKRVGHEVGRKESGLCSTFSPAPPHACTITELVFEISEEPTLIGRQHRLGRVNVTHYCALHRL